jgi:hypothetical protein
LHLQVVESFLATFLIVMSLTSFQYPSAVTLKEIGLKQISVKFGSKSASTPAFFLYPAVALQSIQWDSWNTLPPAS